MTEYAAPESAEAPRREPLKLKKSSGRFELDEQGWTRWYPPEKGDRTLAYYNQWIFEQIERAEREHEARWRVAAENVETYALATVPVKGMSETAIAPAGLARAAADQTEANIVNALLRPRPIMSCDPYFHAELPVLVRVTGAQVREKGVNLDEGIGDNDEIAAPLTVDSETIARRFESGMEFLNRERFDLPGHLHKVVNGCVSSGPVFWVTGWERSSGWESSRKMHAGGFVDLDDVETRHYAKGRISWCIEPYYNVLQSNIDEDIDEQDLVARRDPWKPQRIKAMHARKELFLIKDDEECEQISKITVVQRPEMKERTDASTQHWIPEQRASGEGDCDVREVSFWTEMEAENGERGEVLILCQYHYGARKALTMYDWPYRHGERNVTVFKQSLDGASTVSKIKHRDQLQTHMTQSEIKGAYKARNPQRWVDPSGPNNSLVRAAFDGREVNPDIAIPGIPGKDFGFEESVKSPYSLLGHMQWNAAEALRASKQGYGTGDPVVSHTSPTTVNAMLERSDQGELLFIRMIDRGFSRVMRQTLENMSQFDPFGEDIPVRDPVTKAIVRAPMLYPLRNLRSNFRISLTAADIAIAQEHDEAQRAQRLAGYQQHSVFVTQIMDAVTALIGNEKFAAIPPELRESLLNYYLRVAEGEAKLYDSLSGMSRTDEESFDLVEPMANLVSKAIDGLRQQQMNGAMNANPAGPQQAILPPQGEVNAGAPSGTGPQPGILEDGANPTGAINPPVA